MKLVFTILLLSMSILTMNAQKGALTSAGENTSQSGNIVSWTIGSTVAGSSVTQSKRISAGVIHPIYNIFYPQDDNAIQIKCSPNPATEFINVELHTNEFEGMSWHLYNVEGKKIQDNKLTFNTFRLSLSTLNAASYILKIYDANQQPVAQAKLLKL